MSQLQLQYGARVLFQGDSITDAGRSRDDDSQLGGGYANMVAAWLTARYPGRNLTFLNRGIGGNRIPDLEARWTTDCIDLQPDWLSILIGINDTVHRFSAQDASSVAEYEAGYRRLLDRVREETEAGLIILEPFLLPTPPERAAWRPLLDQHIDAARRVARDYQAIYIPLDGLLAGLTTHRTLDFWVYDGVHPSQAGHAFIAQAWIRAIETS